MKKTMLSLVLLSVAHCNAQSGLNTLTPLLQSKPTQEDTKPLKVNKTLAQVTVTQGGTFTEPAGRGQGIGSVRYTYITEGPISQKLSDDKKSFTFTVSNNAKPDTYTLYRSTAGSYMQPQGPYKKIKVVKKSR